MSPQTLNPLPSDTPYLPHSFTKLSNFYGVGSVRWKEAHEFVDIERHKAILLLSVLNKEDCFMLCE
jgi:hypothetical protein